MERFEERDLRFEGEIEIREGKRIEEWDGIRIEGIAHRGCQEFCVFRLTNRI